MNEFYNEVLKNNNLTTTEKTVLLYLNSIAIDSKVSLSLVELSNLVNITKPTVIKALNSLQGKGLITKFNEGKRYSKNIYKIIDER